MKFPSILAGLLISALVVTGCASNVKATRTENPPPTEAYSSFGRIEIKPVVLAPEFRGQKANEKSLEKITNRIYCIISNSGAKTAQPGNFMD